MLPGPVPIGRVDLGSAFANSLEAAATQCAPVRALAVDQIGRFLTNIVGIAAFCGVSCWSQRSDLEV